MGQIKRILKQREIPKPPQNERLVVELCENVHLHYRNLRLEFSPEEFLTFLKALSVVDEAQVKNFEYGPGAFETAAYAKLPSETEFDTRLQVEEQVEGHYHVHYRNLRIELGKLGEIGIE